MRRNEERFPVRRDQERGLAPWGESSPRGYPLAPAEFFGGSPWQVMRRMQEDMDRLFSQLFSGGGVEFTPATAGQQWAPSVDISQTDGEWCIEADLPGVDRDSIDVQVQQGHLILRAEMRQQQRPEGTRQPQGDGGQQGAGEQRQYQRQERRYGFLERVLPLPENVDEENIRCEFRNGVLTVHLPRTAEARQQARRIPVTDADRLPSETAAGRTRSAAELSMTEGAGEREEEEEPAAAGAKGGETSSRTSGGQGKPGGRGARQQS